MRWVYMPVSFPLCAIRGRGGMGKRIATGFALAMTWDSFVILSEAKNLIGIDSSVALLPQNDRVLLRHVLRSLDIDTL
jgi:hypothetical protein